MTIQQRRAMNFLRGTGMFVGREALGHFRRCPQFKLRTLLALRKRGLIEHFVAAQWCLTDRGQDLFRDRKQAPL